MSDGSESEGGNLRPLVPITDDAVPGLLRDALDLAVTSRIRGVVVMLAFHDRRPAEIRSAGDLSEADVAWLLAKSQHDLLHKT